MYALLFYIIQQVNYNNRIRKFVWQTWHKDGKQQHPAAMSDVINDC